MDLLSQKQREKIDLALRDVADTFFKTDVTYHIAKTKLDRFGEGQNNGTTTTFKDVIMPCMVEYGMDEIKQNMIGAVNYQGVTLTFHAREWETEGMYQNGELKLVNSNKDYVTVNSRYYKVKSIMPEGSFETQNKLIVLTADLQPSKTA